MLQTKHATTQITTCLCNDHSNLHRYTHSSRTESRKAQSDSDQARDSIRRRSCTMPGIDMLLDNRQVSVMHSNNGLGIWFIEYHKRISQNNTGLNCELS